MARFFRGTRLKNSATGERVPVYEYICPGEAAHEQILRERRENEQRVRKERLQQGGKTTGRSNKGRKRPGAEKNLGDKARKRKGQK